MGKDQYSTDGQPVQSGVSIVYREMESIRDFGRGGDTPRLHGLAENEHTDKMVMILRHGANASIV
jgi:hypothetical protein